MGDMADFALEGIEAEYEHYEKYKYADIGTQYDEGLIDEQGALIGNPSSYPARSSPKKPCGPGECPICASSTVLRDGKFGSFWGCTDFPKCKGSRNCE